MDAGMFKQLKIPNKDVLKGLFSVIEQQYETGQAVPITGGQTMLN